MIVSSGKMVRLAESSFKVSGTSVALWRVYTRIARRFASMRRRASRKENDITNEIVSLVWCADTGGDDEDDEDDEDEEDEEEEDEDEEEQRKKDDENEDEEPVWTARWSTDKFRME
jgi:hypothetical protein